MRPHENHNTKTDKGQTRTYHPILGAMMPPAPAFHTDTSLSKKAVQDYLKTKDIRILTGTP